ncbi:MAG TPA: protein translocase subunit SecF [Candidatus Saccharimonadales bacterium]|nr:protein translocase subunit SecF [Candidatus Saccharimonadales bacterium]
MYTFLGKKKIWWFIFSGLVMVPGIISLFVWKLPLGIDFKGGSQIEVHFAKTVSQTDLTNKVATYPGVKGLTISTVANGDYLLTMLPLGDSDHKTLTTDLNKDFGGVAEVQYQLVGASVSQDLTRKAIIAVVLASILILFYLAYAFRKVAFPVSSWRFGATALAALIHDLVITVGVFSILAHFLKYEVDVTFITAMLTVMGFSVHDTIVVFDRIRENLLKNRVENAEEFEKLSDESLQQTLNRSLATSLTVIFTLIALVAMGGSSIRPFVMTLLVGISIGTYSSIFTATPLLVVWQNRVFNALKTKS